MATEQDEQAVVEKPATESPETSAPGEDAQEDNLDSLLSEWEDDAQEEAKPKGEGSEKTGEQPKGGTDDTSEILDYVREQRAKEIAEQTNRDIQSAAEALRDGWEDAPPTRLLEGEIWRAAGTDRRFLNAFQNRSREPDKWKRILRAKQKELQSEVSRQPDQRATDDREAVTSAVRASSKAPPPAEGPTEQEIANMSDAEYRQYKQSLMR